MSDREVCVFELAGQAFAVDALAVREVVRVDVVRRVPRADGCVEGVFNLRGQIVLAIDLRRRLGMTPGRSQALIVAELDDELVGFLVDSVRDVMKVDRQSLEPVPSTVPEHVRQVVTGALPVPQGWLLCVDLALAAAFDPASSSSGWTPGRDHDAARIGTLSPS